MIAVEPMESRQLLSSVIAGLILINADAGSANQSLKTGTILDLNASAATHLNIRANVFPGVNRIKFNLDGVVSNDSAAPFAVAAAPKVGTHILRLYAWNSRGEEIDSRAVTFSVLDSGATTQPAPPIDGNWKLAFDDEFNNSAIGPTWTNRFWWNGTGGGDELETYTPAAIKVTDGMLQLTATKQNATGADGKTYPYTSGLVSTGGINGKVDPGFTFTYGYIEARMKIPSGKGIWPAFWMLPASHKDANGEIDIMEVVGNAPQTLEVHYHVHGKVVGRSIDTGVDLSADFHTYGVDWEKNSITWYLDGKKLFQVTDNVINEPMYLMINLAVGGNWPGAPDSHTQFPATLQVDYVHVWQSTP